SSGTNGTGGMVYWWKSGTYALAISPTTGACAAQAPCKMYSFQTTRTDAPTVASGNAPIINAAATTLTVGNFLQMTSFTITGTGATVVSVTGTGALFRDV